MSARLTLMEQEVLDMHNRVRARIARTHGTPQRPLIWSASLADDARRYAEHMASTGIVGRSDSSDGEAYYSCESSQNHICTMVDATKVWLAQEWNYWGQKLENPKPGGNGEYHYGFFTQIIWPTTTHVGVGCAMGKDGIHYIVARYSPRGNYLGVSAYTGR